MQSDQDRYKLLDKFVTWGDKQDYRNRFYRDHQNYHVLKENLISSKLRLNHVLFNRDEKHSTSSQKINVKIRKFMVDFSNVAIFKKFVTIHLAPPRFRGNIRKKLYLDIKKFDLAFRIVIGVSSQETKKGS